MTKVDASRDNEEEVGRRSHLVWPIGITVALLIVVIVNVAFIIVAVDGADPVAESYEAGER